MCEGINFNDMPMWYQIGVVLWIPTSIVGAVLLDWLIPYDQSKYSMM